MRIFGVVRGFGVGVTFLFAVVGLTSCSSAPVAPEAASCESAVTANCFVATGTAKSYMGMFTGLAIETENGEYAVFEVASHAEADRKKCDLKTNCVGKFTICPIEKAAAHGRQPVCLNEMKIDRFVPTGQ